MLVVPYNQHGSSHINSGWGVGISNITNIGIGGRAMYGKRRGRSVQISSTLSMIIDYES